MRRSFLAASMMAIMSIGMSAPAHPFQAQAQTRNRRRKSKGTGPFKVHDIGRRQKNTQSGESARRLRQQTHIELKSKFRRMGYSRKAAARLARKTQQAG